MQWKLVRIFLNFRRVTNEEEGEEKEEEEEESLNT